MRGTREQRGEQQHGRAAQREEQPVVGLSLRARLVRKLLRDHHHGGREHRHVERGDEHLQRDIEAQAGRESGGEGERWQHGEAGEQHAPASDPIGQTREAEGAERAERDEPHQARDSGVGESEFARDEGGDDPGHRLEVGGEGGEGEQRRHLAARGRTLGGHRGGSLREPASARRSPAGDGASGRYSGFPCRPAPAAKRAAPSRDSPERITSSPRRVSRRSASSSERFHCS